MLKINGIEVVRNIAFGEDTFAFGGVDRLESSIAAACAHFWRSRGLREPTTDYFARMRFTPAEREVASRQRQAKSGPRRKRPHSAIRIPHSAFE